MAVYHSVRSRRYGTIEKQSTKQVISFRLLGEFFALPINSVQKVIPLTRVYGDPSKIGVSLIQYQGKELLVLDINRIFQNPFPEIKSNLHQQRFLLVVENQAKDLIGLPIDSPPSLRRVPVSGFVVLPEAYTNKGHIRFLSSIAIQLKNKSSLLLFDPEKLFQ